MIDPEALVLATGAFTADERRFVDVLAWLAERGSTLLSVQRIKTLTKIIPGASRSAAAFAHWAQNKGGDRRWAGLAQPGVEAVAGPGVEGVPRSGKGPDVPDLSHTAAALFRMRAAWGVGVKADLYAYLLCLGGEGKSAPEIAEAIAYTDKSVRAAVRDLRLAGLVEEFGDYPVEYAAPRRSSQLFLQLMYGEKVNTPEWCSWDAIYGLLIEVAQWRDQSGARVSQYIASSRARDLFERYEAVFRSNRLRLPRPEPHPGPAYLSVFGEFLNELQGWMEEV